MDIHDNENNKALLKQKKFTSWNFNDKLLLDIDDDSLLQAIRRARRYEELERIHQVRKLWKQCLNSKAYSTRTAFDCMVGSIPLGYSIIVMQVCKQACSIKTWR
jgi:hypothetical protein